MATRAGEAIKNSLGLGSEAFTYLASHGSLDVGHTDFYARLINRIDDPADRAVLIHAARVFYKLYGDIFRELAARFFPAIAEKAAA